MGVVQSDTRPQVPTRGGCGERDHRDADAWIGAELRSVISSARRRAIRDADRQIDTAHLLHSLLEADPRCREAVLAAAGGAAGYPVARVLAYLVQRSIGYGMRWRGSVEDSGARPAGSVAAAPGWSPAATAALDEAALHAAADGRADADGRDLLGALAADSGCRAADVLRAAGVDPGRLAVPPAVDAVARTHHGDAPVAN